MQKGHMLGWARSRFDPPNHTKDRPWCILSWDLNKDALLYVHVEDSFASESIAGRKLCRNRWEMVTCVVGYGKKLFGKEKGLEKKSVTSNTTSSSSRLGREKASEPEPPLPPPQQHPLNDEDYVDPLLFYHESYQLDNVIQAGSSTPFSSTSHETPSHHPIRTETPLLRTWRTQAHSWSPSSQSENQAEPS
ncbi:hypothetical protein BKA70DRAFT_1232566 [Coprinopsis sp. MPI-PUGE-AT-0042]|nr:hypothetical protein BKA70DRAFT_1232566 [Coprinopsis sp. MPI-PUGE-AT-0042]